MKISNSVFADNSTHKYHCSENTSLNKWISRDLLSFSCKVNLDIRRKHRGPVRYGEKSGLDKEVWNRYPAGGMTLCWAANSNV